MPKLILILATIFSLSAHAQTSLYHPFPDSNAVWIGRSWHNDGPTCTVEDDYNLFILGDTIIGSYTYNKLYKNGFLWSNCPPPGYYYYGEFAGVFRQDVLNKKVYINKFGADELAYDFNLGIGDTLPVSGLGGSSFVITFMDSILVGTDYRKRFWLDNSADAALIEGVGSTYGAFAPIAPPFESGNDLYCLRLDSLPAWTALNGYCNLIGIEELTESAQLFIPNPFRENSVIRSTKNLTNATAIVYNMSGQKTIQVNHISGTEINIPVQGLRDGIYFIILTQESKRVSNGIFVLMN